MEVRQDMQYALHFMNESSLSGSLSLYMRQKDQEDALFSVVFQSVACMPRVRAGLSWNDTFCLVWGEPGALRQGSVFFPRQFAPVSPGESMMLEGDGAGCSFVGKGGPVPPDSFGIGVGPGIPGHTWSLGFGVDNRAGFVCEAGPNLSYVFSAANLEYWAIFGAFPTGWVFDPRYFAPVSETSRQLFATRPLRLPFTPQAGTLDIFLDADNVLKMR